MTRAFRLSRLLLAIVLLLVATSVLAQAGGLGTTIDTVNARSGPGTNYDVIGIVHSLTRVIFEGRTQIGDWVLVRTQDGSVRGWVASRYIDFDDGVELAYLPVTGELLGPAPASSSPAENTAPSAAPAAPPLPSSSGNAYTATSISPLNVRSGPGINADVQGTIDAEQQIVIEGRTQIGDWLLVHVTDGSVRGWVASRYVDFDAGVEMAYIPVVNSSAPTTATTNTTTNTSAPAPVAVNTSGGISGTTTTILNMRSGPGVEHDVIGELSASATVTILGRNAMSSWLYVQTPDGALSGWVSARYMRFGGDAVLAKLAVIDDNGDVVAAAPTEGEAEAGVTPPPSDVLAGDVPEGDIDAMVERLMNTPVLYNMTNGNVRTIFARGQLLGNNPHVFMKVGDSVTAGQPFLYGFGLGQYNLGPYAHLQATIDWFMVPPREGYNSSWTNESLAARTGFTVPAVFDGLWVNPEICSEGPIYCEYNLIKPSVAIIYFGSQDLQISAPFTFQSYMYGIAEVLTERGVIPVFTTFAYDPDIRYADTVQFNNIILNVARDYNVPLINFWRAAQALPNGGVMEDDPVHLSQGPTFYSFNGEENLYGVTLRNLLTLQALDEIRRGVLVAGG